MARWALVSLGQVQVLDLAATDPNLKGFFGGFSDGNYGYAAPYFTEGIYWASETSAAAAPQRQRRHLPCVFWPSSAGTQEEY